MENVFVACLIEKLDRHRFALANAFPDFQLLKATLQGRFAISFSVSKNRLVVRPPQFCTMQTCRSDTESFSRLFVRKCRRPMKLGHLQNVVFYARARGSVSVSIPNPA